MKITKEQLKNIVRETLQEESEYQTFFKKALEKAGKSIPSMSDEEKKAFFNKIEKTWKGKGQKSEGNAFGAAVAKAKKDGDDSFEVDGKEYKTERFGRGHEGPTFGSEEESVNESIEPQIKKIAYFTGTRPEAVEDFVSKHALNITKLLKYVEKGGLPQRMELVSALAGRPNNPVQKKIIKMFKESVNEGKFKVDDLVYNTRTKTVGIVRMGDDKYGEVKTDADGNVDVDELEKYNPIKFKHQTKAKVAPSTEREVNKRGLFNPFKMESVINEGPSTEEKRIAMLAVRKQAKYRNVSLEQAIQDQINALEDLKRDVKKGKLK